MQKNNFLLLKKWKNTGSAQPWKNWFINIPLHASAPHQNCPVGSPPEDHKGPLAYHTDTGYREQQLEDIPRAGGLTLQSLTHSILSAKQYFSLFAKVFRFIFTLWDLSMVNCYVNSHLILRKVIKNNQSNTLNDKKYIIFNYLKWSIWGQKMAL